MEGGETVEIYRVRVKGTKPLLVHAPVGISDKPTRRRGEHFDPKKEAEQALYRNDSGEPCIPAFNVKACLRNAGRNYKVSGRKSTFGAIILAGIDIRPEMIKIQSNDGWKIDLRTVVVQRNRIIRARPRFDDWALEFEILNLDPTIIHTETLQRILEDAGKYCGLGDFRPMFGTLQIEEFEEEK